MRDITLIFSSIDEFLDFQRFIDIVNSDVLFDGNMCTGTFSEAQIELAVNGMKAKFIRIDSIELE